MVIAVQNVLDCLERAGLLPKSEASQALVGLMQTGKPVDGVHLVSELIGRGILTAYQAREVEAGRGEQLVLGNYVILDEIGGGGMGRVYKALHRRMNRVVAFKLLHKELTNSPDMVARFQQEVQAAARLNHPNAVAAYDADECELGCFLVMEYVDGCDLGRLVAKMGPLRVPEVVDVIRQSALGLGYAHAQKVIHRDIKPANLLRDVSGVVKIADLGLALLGRRASERAPGGATREEGNWVAGTLGYMSPEQTVDTDAVDHRADIYSLGCTLYFLLTGQPLFPDSDSLRVMQAHQSKPPPPLAAARHDAGEALNALYEKMVAKRPEHRPQSMAEVVRSLDALPETVKGIAAKAWDPAASTYLIVESSRLMTGVVRRCLGELGGDDIHVCGTAAEALALLERLPADVIFTSQQLPDFTGLELSQRLRQQLPWSRAAVVIMTSEPTPRLRDSVQHLGMVAVLAKPFDRAQLKSAMAAARNSTTAAAQIANLADRDVLIVDDSSVARRRIQQVLTDLGFTRFTAAADGIEAIAALARQPFDLVVTDYNMPRLDGRELVTHVRQNGPHKDVPIILCTTEFDPGKLAVFYQLGVSAICNKSFDSELVRNIVVRLFK